MRLGLIARNSAANLLGQLVSKGLKIVLVPLQIHLLGDQAFGIVGFYALILGLAAFLDLGLSLTANREVARVDVAAKSGMQAVRNLVRTFEIPYWLLGGVLGTVVHLHAGWFSDNWITAPDLSRETIVFSVSVIGLMLAIRWPVSLYRGVLFGLQHQVEANLLGIGSELVNGVGSVLVIILDPRLEAFFFWQLAASLTEVSAHLWYCWRALSNGGLPRPYFDLFELRRVWRYALGVNVTALIGSVLGRADSVILSKLLPISFLGYYSIAQRVPFLIGMFPASLITATTPLLVSTYEQSEMSQLCHVYRRQTRWLSLVGTGLAGALAAFSYPLLLLWTQSEHVASTTALPFAIISAASSLDVMTSPVNQLSLACGFTGPPMIVGSIAGIVVAAGTLLLAPSLGICGAALAWGFARIVTFFLYPLLVHRLVLPDCTKEWFLCDTLPLLAIGGLCFGCGGYFFHHLALSPHSLFWIPVMAASGLLYLGLVLALDLLPDWKAVLNRKLSHG